MLSPNARNEVVDSLGGLSTVTRNEQLSVRCSASVAAHVTVFCPTVNADPAAGVHVVVTGACPFATVGAVKVTLVDTPSIDCAVIAAGHVIFGGSGVGGTGFGTWVGVDGLAHALSASAPSTEHTLRNPTLHTKRH
jgi:hypothetical protein